MLEFVALTLILLLRRRLEQLEDFLLLAQAVNLLSEKMNI